MIVQLSSFILSAMDGSTAQQDALKFAAMSAGQSARERAARRLGSTVFYALLALMTLAAIPYGTVQPWWQALFECAVFALAALGFIEGYRSGAWKLSQYRLLWPLVALAAFALLQTISTGGASEVSLKVGGVWEAISADPHGTRRWVAKMLALVLTGAMLLRYTRNERRLRVLVIVVIGIAMASAVFGLVRQMTQRQVGFILPSLRPGFGYAQFINKNHFPFLMEMALGLVFGLAVGDHARRERLILYLGAGLLLAGALVSANSRGGILSLLCQVLFAALLFSTVRRVRDEQAGSVKASRWVQAVGRSLVARALLIICLLVALMVGIVWLGGDSLVGSLEALPTEVGAPAEGIRWSVRRKDIWPATWQLIKDYPVAGVGFGGYWMAITEYHQGSGEMTPQEAHNDYLEFLASGGLIGLALGAWFIYAFVQRVRLQLRSANAFRRAMSYGALVGLSGVAVHSLFDFGLHITVNAAVFIALIAIATTDIAPRGLPDKH